MLLTSDLGVRVVLRGEVLPTRVFRTWAGTSLVLGLERPQLAVADDEALTGGDAAQVVQLLARQVSPLGGVLVQGEMLVGDRQDEGRCGCVRRKSGR